jgi:hypothetical protein
MNYTAVYKDVRRVVAKRFPFSVYFRAEAHRNTGPSGEPSQTAIMCIDRLCVYKRRRPGKRAADLVQRAHNHRPFKNDSSEAGAR